MIKGKKKEELSSDSILKRITEYDIYRRYFGDFEINKVTKNHLRSEENASFIIGNKNGYLSHWDFGDSYWRGDCFSLVMQIYKCDYNTALKIIDRDFGLGISSNENIGAYKTIVSRYEQPKVTKKNNLIQVIVRKFTSEELNYWKQYHIDIEDLKRNNVFSIKSLFLNRKRFYLNENELRFGYYYDGYWKIYRPFASKKLKWLPNNVPITTLDGKENIVNCDIAFINKSKKDMMVTYKVYPCTIAVQNESFACFSQENVNYIKENSKYQILSFDADTPGVKNSIEVTKMFGFDYCNVPKRYLSQGIKDWADLAKVYGLKEVEKIITEKIKSIKL